MSKTPGLVKANEKLKKQKLPEFDVIYKQFNLPLCFFACRLVKDNSVAQDIVTEVFLKFWEKQGSFKTLYSVKAFLYISTHNACANHNKSVGFHDRVHEYIRAGLSEIETGRIDEGIYLEIVTDAYDLINCLPEKCREVMQLSYLDGLGAREIARLKNANIHTVKNQRARGVQIIKQNDAIKQKWLCLTD